MKALFVIATVTVVLAAFMALRRASSPHPTDKIAIPTPRPPDDPQLAEAHRRSIRHREEILRSEQCGCFYCLAGYPPSDITEWSHGGHVGRSELPRSFGHVEDSEVKAIGAPTSRYLV